MAKTTKGRIDYPKTFQATMRLAEKIYEKHLTDGADSPLLQMEDYDWAVAGPALAAIKELHEQAERHKALMEQSYSARNAKLPEIMGIINASKALLKAIHYKHPKRLGAWGFQVDDTPKARKKPEGNI